MDELGWQMPIAPLISQLDFRAIAPAPEGLNITSQEEERLHRLGYQMIASCLDLTFVQ